MGCLPHPGGFVSARLRLLVIDDSADDVRLVARALRPTFPDLSWRQVDTAPALAEALRDPPWDAVLCDHGVPGLPTAQAVARVREVAPDVPVIVVSGNGAPSAAARALEAGAVSFVQKEQLTRLPALMEDLLSRRPTPPPSPRPPPPDPVANWRPVFECLFDAVFITDADGRVAYANWRAAAQLGTSPDQLIGCPVPVRVPAPVADCEIVTGACLVRHDGRSLPAEVATALLSGGRNAGRLWVVRDLTAMRRLRERVEDQSRRHQERLTEATRRAAQFAGLVGGLQLACRCTGRTLAARTPEEIARAVRQEVADATGVAWSDAAVWVRRPPEADAGGGLMLTGQDELVALGSESWPSLPEAAEHAYAAVGGTGDAESDRDGELIAPLRARVGVRGVLVLRWDVGSRASTDPTLRAGLCDVARTIADAIGMALEWHAQRHAQRRNVALHALASLGGRVELIDALRRASVECERSGLPCSVLAADCAGVSAALTAGTNGAAGSAAAGVAQAIEETCWRSDLGFRVGDAGFVLVLPGIDAGSAALVAGRLRRRLDPGLCGAVERCRAPRY